MSAELIVSSRGPWKLNLGSGTKMTVTDRGVCVGEQHSEDTVWLRVSATIRLEADVLYGCTEHLDCAVCGAAPPPPGEDAVMYVLENNDGGRLVFPCAEDVEPDRDRYPVPGWRNTEGGLTCPECYAEISSAVSVAVARRKQGVGRG